MNGYQVAHFKIKLVFLNTLFYASESTVSAKTILITLLSVQVPNPFHQLVVVLGIEGERFDGDGYLYLHKTEARTGIKGLMSF